MPITSEKLGEAVLELRTDDKQLDKGIDSAHAKAQGLSKQFDATASSLKGATNVLPDLDSKLGDVGNSLSSASDQAASAASNISGAGGAARGAGDDFRTATASAKSMGAALGILLAVGNEAKSTLRDIGEELEEIANRAGRTTAPFQQFTKDLKGIVLTGPMEAIQIWLRGVNEELDRLVGTKTVQQLGGQLSSLDRIAVRLADSLGLLPEKIGRIGKAASLQREFAITDALRAMREETERSTELTIGDEDTLGLKQLEKAVERAEELTAGLRGLGRAGDDAKTRLRDLRAEHEASLAVIEDREQLEALFAETMQMVTQEAQEQLDEWRDLTSVVEGYIDEAFRLDQQRFDETMRDIFPEQAEIARLQSAADTLREMATLKIISPEQLAEGLEVVEERTANVGREVSDTAAAWFRVGQEAANALDGIDSGLARTAQQALAVASAIQALVTALQTGQAAAGWIGFVAAAVSIFSGGNKPDVPFGVTPVEIGQGGVDFPFDPEQRAGFSFGDPSQAGFFSSPQVAKMFADFQRVLEGALREMFSQIGSTIPDITTDFVLSSEKGLIKVRDRLTLETIAVFSTWEEAIGFSAQRSLQAAVEAGIQIDEAVRQLITAYQGDPSQFPAAVARVQELADQASMFIDQIGAVGIEVEKGAGRWSAMTQELKGFGLQADQITRLVGGDMVASFQAWRQALTGQGMSVEQQRQMAETSRQLFNAEMELQIAELEAKKAGLLAEAGLTEQQVALINAQLGVQADALAAEGKIAQARTGMQSNVIHAEERFLQARGKLATAELGVMGGFTNAAAGIVQVGAGMLESFAGALAQLPEEIAAQVKAIQAVIDALKRIGTISPGEIRIPGAPTFRQPAFGGGVPGRGVSGPAADASRAIADLIASLTDLASQTEETIGRMESAVEDLEDFQRGLLIGPLTPLPPGQQIAAIEGQLAAARAAFLGGDVTAGADIQRLAQQLLQVTQATFGAAGPGFQSRFREVQDILDETIGEGNAFIETELEELQAMRTLLADLLEQNPRAHELSKEQIAAIREGNEDNRTGLVNVAERVDDLEDSFLSELRALRRAIVDLAERPAA